VFRCDASSCLRRGNSDSQRPGQDRVLTLLLPFVRPLDAFRLGGRPSLPSNTPAREARSPHRSPAGRTAPSRARASSRTGRTAAILASEA